MKVEENFLLDKLAYIKYIIHQTMKILCISDISKIEPVVYYQCCVLIG